jgi:hypothetical protein
MELLAEKAESEGKSVVVVVVVLDNASLHKAGAVGERRLGWEAR